MCDLKDLKFPYIVDYHNKDITDKAFLAIPKHYYIVKLMESLQGPQIKEIFQAHVGEVMGYDKPGKSWMQGGLLLPAYRQPVAPGSTLMSEAYQVPETMFWTFGQGMEFTNSWTIYDGKDREYFENPKAYLMWMDLYMNAVKQGFHWMWIYIITKIYGEKPTEKGILKDIFDYFDVSEDAKYKDSGFASRPLTLEQKYGITLKDNIPDLEKGKAFNPLKVFGLGCCCDPAQGGPCPCIIGGQCDKWHSKGNPLQKMLESWRKCWERHKITSEKTKWIPDKLPGASPDKTDLEHIQKIYGFFDAIDKEIEKIVLGMQYSKGGILAGHMSQDDEGKDGVVDIDGKVFNFGGEGAFDKIKEKCKDKGHNGKPVHQVLPSEYTYQDLILTINPCHKRDLDKYKFVVNNNGGIQFPSLAKIKIIESAVVDKKHAFLEAKGAWEMCVRKHPSWSESDIGRDVVITEKHAKERLTNFYMDLSLFFIPNPERLVRYFTFPT